MIPWWEAVQRIFRRLSDGAISFSRKTLFRQVGLLRDPFGGEAVQRIFRRSDSAIYFQAIL